MEFNSNTDKRGSIICASVIGIFFAILSTILRVVARRKVGAPLKADDYWIFFATFMASNVVISTFATVRWGLGLHIDQVTSMESLAQSIIASQVFYSLAVPTIKISILCLYHRIFPSRTLWKLSIAIGVLVVLYSVAQIILMLTQCIPLSALWDPANQDARCIDINPVYITVAILNVVTDVLILTVPIKYVVSLELKQSRKLQLLSVFLLGSCVCAFSIVRAVAVSTANIHDISFNDVSSSIWSEVEICVGVVSANLPCLRPLVRSLPSVLGGGSTGQAPGAYGRSTKRASRGHNGFEMAGRRPKSGFGQWGRFDVEESDVRPFAGATIDGADVRSSPSHSRSVSRVEEAKSEIYKGRGTSFGKGIMVETTIEVESSAVGRPDSREG